MIENLIRHLIDSHGRKRESLLPILQGVVEQEKTLENESIRLIAKELELSTATVYGVASFYSFLDTEPRGKYIIRICKSISCGMKCKNQIIKTIEETLKISLGETTKDKKFTLLETNCLGRCHEGPAILINDDVYSNLTPERIIKILDIYIKKPGLKL